jgi:uncharacterized glyoxalase superfamily protein PhnB
LPWGFFFRRETPRTPSHQLRFNPRTLEPSAAELGGSAGALAYLHVDDLPQTFERLVAMGATVHEPITKRGTSGFVTASVVDPFGNIVGIMSNAHYLDVLSQAATSK